MSVERSRTVEWDGEALIGWVAINGIPTKVRANREVIHSKAAGFNDAVSWEIERHRIEIFEKLIPFLARTQKESPSG